MRALIQVGRGRWLAFSAAVAELAADRVDAVRPCLAEVARRVEADGLWAVGFVAYEAAPAFDRALAAREPDPEAGLPLAWFALCPRPEELGGPDLLRGETGAYEVGPWIASVGDDAYRAAVEAVRRRIAAGDTYQANLTYRLAASFAGDPRGLFLDLAAAQGWPGAPGGGSAAYLDAGRHAVCCASPELFFERTGERVVCRPMKGTAPRGLTGDDDRRRAAALAASPKERAENLMIVDMVRNDLGRVAEAGSVAAPRRLAVERYPTVLQMTSTVTARSRASWPELFAALFPCASITGAPKSSTTRILAGLETTPRGVYTGAVGWLAPDGRSRFAVAIRTAVVDRERGRAEYGAGGGIVWDSDADRELAETLVKARVLPSGRGPRPAEEPLELLETLAWTPDGGFALLAEHLARLAASAEYFGYPFDEAAVRQTLATAVEAWLEAVDHGGVPLRVRLRLSADGSHWPEVEPLADGPEPVPVALAAEPLDPEDRFLYHKTTRRRVYERALAEARRRVPEAADVLLWNPAGELTESTVASLVAGADGGRVTPPVACGLLPGILRGRLVARGEVRERAIGVEELLAADRAGELWLVSSVRGWRRARLVGGVPGRLAAAGAVAAGAGTTLAPSTR